MAVVSIEILSEDGYGQYCGLRVFGVFGIAAI
jgi:hypothetical protein